MPLNIYNILLYLLLKKLNFKSLTLPWKHQQPSLEHQGTLCAHAE